MIMMPAILAIENELGESTTEACPVARAAASSYCHVVTRDKTMAVYGVGH